jgi:hypothetical protein
MLTKKEFEMYEEALREVRAQANAQEEEGKP